MAVKAYILIEAEGSKVGDACITIRNIPGVESADVVTGILNIIALAQAEDLEKFEFVISKILVVDGVQRIQTALVVPFEKRLGNRCAS